MTIREILDAVDREVAGSRAAIKRLTILRRRIVQTCRDADDGDADKNQEHPRCLPISEHASRRPRVKAA